MVEVWIEAFSSNPEQINKFDWLGREIGRKWSFWSNNGVVGEEVSLLGEEDPLYIVGGQIQPLLEF